MEKQLHFIFYSKLHLYGGGIETWADYFLKQLSIEMDDTIIRVYLIEPENKQESIVFGLEKYKNIKFEYLQIGDVVKQNTIINFFKYDRAIKNLLRKNLNSNDIIVSIGLLNSGIVLLNRGLLKRNKFITWIRSKSVGEISTYKSKRYVFLANFLEKVTILKSDYIITNGDDTLEYYAEKYPYHKKKMRRIFNAVDISKFAYISEKKFESKLINIAYTGRLSIAKGFTDFLQVADKLSKKTKNFKFNIYGDDASIEKTNLDFITFKGKYEPENISEILELNDIVLFLNRESQAGGVSHSLLEAMASGKLIVAWDNYTHNQVLNINNSILVKESDLHLLEQTLINIKNNKFDIKTLRENAKNDAKLYSTSRHIQEFNEVIKKVSGDLRDK
ncbi:glycosyltransferase family 4 protein [Solibacillus sp. NPDC093137]|uniref:glycosyltransferase family 4 protein n=1 Tax=Solibacillus sp. NPDC093137 TaxID=3390678 RepID=UPI003D02031C